MRIISLPPILEFGATHADAEESIRAWIATVRVADWHSFHEITAQFATASILGNSRVCFNIRGNHYRLIVAVLIRNKSVLIKFVGTHAEYDRINAETVEL